MSTLANVRFIADSTNQSFWGSNLDEQNDIERIRSEFAPYLYDNNPPKDVMDDLGPVADSLIAALKNPSKVLLFAISMYENQKEN